jgi:probable F420-dependent oxidoreductase
MTATARYGITVPFDGLPLGAQREWFEEAEHLGYTDFWGAETAGYDGFTPLALASVWTPSMRLGIAIIPVYTHGPALLASQVLAMAHAAPGRFALGIGTSSNVIVERWNGIAFEKPYQRARDTLRFLRQALTGEKVTEQYETFEIKGFRLERGLAPDETPPILLAALRPGMLRLAGREADGAIINWLSPEDVTKVVPHVGEGKEIVARLFCCPSEDAATVRAQGKFAIAAYLNVPVYAAFHEWLGRGPQLKEMWEAWQAGDRKAAVAAIPDEVVDDLIIHGSPEVCRERVAGYVRAGVTTPALAVLPLAGVDTRQALRDLAPQ